MQAQTFESVLKLMRSGASNSPLLRLLEIVQIVADSSAAALFVSRNGQQEIVLGRGMPYSFFKSPMPDEPPLSGVFEQPLIVEDANDHPVLRTRRFDLMRDQWRWFAGVPLEMPQLAYKLTLLAMTGRAGQASRPDLLAKLVLLSGVVADELRLIGDIVTHRESAGNLMMEADCVREAVDGSTLPMILIDHHLRTDALSEPMAALMDADAKEQRGQAVVDLLGDERDELLQFLRHRLRSMGGEQTFQLPATNRHPALELSALHCTEVGTGDDAIFVTAQPPSLPSRVREDVVGANFHPKGGGEPTSVTCDFLLSTLVPAQRVRRRGRTDYHTLMRWRSPVKDAQIAALRALKRSIPAGLIERVADQMADAATSLFGRGTVRALCAVPCGHSGPECLSQQLGRAVADRLNLPFRAPFAPLPAGGSSHPASNAKRPAMTLVEPIDVPVLLIDDVATSGSHIDEAARKLKAHAPAVLPLAWIGS